MLILKCLICMYHLLEFTLPDSSIPCNSPELLDSWQLRLAFMNPSNDLVRLGSEGMIYFLRQNYDWAQSFVPLTIDGEAKTGNELINVRTDLVCARWRFTRVVSKRDKYCSIFIDSWDDLINQLCIWFVTWLVNSMRYRRTIFAFKLI
jgi:hypothetical protein